ncbi:MAG: hypothetical protein E6Q06_02015 [Candidatus Moraniibacteriota bacterium]|nr:MAG: hypothetical protein E6Q06_02015 [Candidatus Moranbacteria bacterium]
MAADSYSVLDLDGAPIPDYNIPFDPTTHKTGFQWLDNYLSGLVSEAAKRQFLEALCRMCCPRSEDDMLLLQAMAEAPHEKLVQVSSMIEVGVLAMFLFFVKFEYVKSPDCWLVIDLPPGVGKSFEIERLCPLFSEYYRRQYKDEHFERVLITTPTAKTRNAYSFARVLHSQMGLPIRKPGCDPRQYAAAIRAGLAKPCKTILFAHVLSLFFHVLSCALSLSLSF